MRHASVAIKWNITEMVNVFGRLGQVILEGNDRVRILSLILHKIIPNLGHVGQDDMVYVKIEYCVRVW